MKIFQYGSNCLDAELNGPTRLCGDAQFDGVGVADGYEQSFEVWSKGRNCAASNLAPRTGAEAWGVLYEIPDALMNRDTAEAFGRRSMDAIEGEGKNYRRAGIEVRRPSGEVVYATTYLVIKPTTEHRTSAAYVKCIIQGLWERGVPELYISRVREIAVANNPDLIAEIESL
jgi:hypothetical protein